jgi:hypothetical protein
MTRQIVQVNCTVEGYEDIWLKYDVTDWGVGVFTDLPFRSFAWTVRYFIPENCVDWLMRNDGGDIIAHPGSKASEEVWAEVWKSLGPETSRAIYHWLALSALVASGEAMDLPPKSLADGPGAGPGAQDAAGRNADESAG